MRFEDWGNKAFRGSFPRTSGQEVGVKIPHLWSLFPPNTGGETAWYCLEKATGRTNGALLSVARHRDERLRPKRLQRTVSLEKLAFWRTLEPRIAKFAPRPPLLSAPEQNGNEWHSRHGWHSEVAIDAALDHDLCDLAVLAGGDVELDGRGAEV